MPPSRAAARVLGCRGPLAACRRMRRPGGRLHRRHRTRDHRQHAPDDHDGTSLTTEEVAWLDALTDMKETFEKKRDKVLRAGTGGVSRALEALLGKTVGACGRDLARVGPPPSDRLQPVYALAKKACQQFGKAARCHATVVAQPAERRGRRRQPTGAAMEAGEPMLPGRRRQGLGAPRAGRSERRRDPGRHWMT